MVLAGTWWASFTDEDRVGTQNPWTWAKLPCPSIKSSIMISLCVGSFYIKHYIGDRRTVRAVRDPKGLFAYPLSDGICYFFEPRIDKLLQAPTHLVSDICTGIFGEVSDKRVTDLGARGGLEFSPFCPIRPLRPRSTPVALSPYHQSQ